MPNKYRAKPIDYGQRESSMPMLLRRYLMNIGAHPTRITSDPDDSKFVDCAICGQAEYLVSNDNHFKILNDIKFLLTSGEIQSVASDKISHSRVC